MDKEEEGEEGEKQATRDNSMTRKRRRSWRRKRWRRQQEKTA